LQTICDSCGATTPEGAIICPDCDRESIAGATPAGASHVSNLRAGKASVVLSIVVGAGAPVPGLLVALYGLYRLARVPNDISGVTRWRSFGVFVTVLLGVYWGIHGRIALS
jgi:hypothetical protein